YNCIWFVTRPNHTSLKMNLKVDRRAISKMKRGEFLRALSLTSAACLAGSIAWAVQKPRHILVVSGWQDVNIGDIAHTPGLLHILQTYFPESRITLWKKSHNECVGQMLKDGFPNVRVIYGDVDRDTAHVESTEVLGVFEQAD